MFKLLNYILFVARLYSIILMTFNLEPYELIEEVSYAFKMTSFVVHRGAKVFATLANLPRKRSFRPGKIELSLKIERQE